MKVQHEMSASRSISVDLTGSTVRVVDVPTVTSSVTVRENLPAYDEEYAKHFPADEPAKSTVLVNLGSADLLVEITATACITD